MISKAKRISREDFEKVMNPPAGGGAMASSSLFSLRYLKNVENKRDFAVVVSKKVAKTAVLRNKIRRRAYSILAKISQKPYKMAFFAKKGVEKATFAEIRADIEKLIAKV